MNFGSFICNFDLLFVAVLELFYAIQYWTSNKISTIDFLLVYHPAQLYTKHAHEMGFDECHMFLRCVQFEFASFKENADQPPPLFITSIQEDDTSIDR